MTISEIKPTDWAYAAGIFEGEGCVTITHKKRTRDSGERIKEYGLRVIVSQSDRRMTDWLVRFGGKVYPLVNPRWFKNANFQWQVNGRLAAAFLRGVAPYLLVKKEQTEIALALQDRVNSGAPLTADECQAREELLLMLKAAKYAFLQKVEDFQQSSPMRSVQPMVIERKALRSANAAQMTFEEAE